MDYETIRTILETALNARKKWNEKLTADFDGKLIRFGRYNENDKTSEPFIFAKGKRRYGNTLSDYIRRHNTQNVIVIAKKTTDEAKQWQKGWEKVCAMLEISGLYPDLLAEKRLALAIGFDKIKQADEQYWKKDNNLSYDKLQKTNAEKIQEIDERLVKTNDKSEVYANTGIIWHTTHAPKIKKMNFGKYDTTEKLAEIAHALKHKEKIHVSGRTSYDVSFEYNPEIKKAWYSEEFRGCGNGHYYLALNATHALFYEDD